MSEDQVAALKSVVRQYLESHGEACDCDICTDAREALGEEE